MGCSPVGMLKSMAFAKGESKHSKSSLLPLRLLLMTDALTSPAREGEEIREAPP